MTGVAWAQLKTVRYVGSSDPKNETGFKALFETSFTIVQSVVRQEDPTGLEF